MASQVADAFAARTTSMPDARLERQFPAPAKRAGHPAEGQEVRPEDPHDGQDHRNPFVDFRTSGWPTTRLLGQTAVRRRGHQPAGQAWRVHRHRRSLGLRQVHLHEADHRPETPEPRQHHHRRPAGDRPAEDHRHGLPGAVVCCPGAPRSTTCCCRWRSSSPTARASSEARRGICRRTRRLLRQRRPGRHEDKFPWELSGGMQQRPASAAR